MILQPNITFVPIANPNHINPAPIKKKKKKSEIWVSIINLLLSKKVKINSKQWKKNSTIFSPCKLN